MKVFIIGASRQNASKALPNTTPKSRSQPCPRNDTEHWKTWSTIPGVAFRCANLLSLETLASDCAKACPPNELPGQCHTSLHILFSQVLNGSERFYWAASRHVLFIYRQLRMCRESGREHGRRPAHRWREVCFLF